MSKDKREAGIDIHTIQRYSRKSVQKNVLLGFPYHDM
jgi:hypothetical protein